MNLARKFGQSAPQLGRILFTAGLFALAASAQTIAPWSKAVTGIDAMFAGTWTTVIGIAICILGLCTFVFGSGHAKMAAVAELVLGGGIVVYHATLTSIF